MEDFDLEAEYEKYKAAQRAHIVKPEWQRLAEEDLKDLLTKPEFNMSPEMVNWINLKKQCEYCGRVMTGLTYGLHSKRCQKNSNKILVLLEENEDITIKELSEKTGFNAITIQRIFKKLNITHKFSKKSNYTQHEKYREKFLIGAKKGGETQTENFKKAKEEKHRLLWENLPAEIFSSEMINKIAKNLNIFDKKRLRNFKSEKWVLLVHEGNIASSTNPPLWIKNPDKSTDLNYTRPIVTQEIILSKLKSIADEHFGRSQN